MNKLRVQACLCRTVTSSWQQRMSYRAGSEEFEEEEEEEEEEEKEEGSARSLAVAGEDGSKRQGGLGTGEGGVNHESRRSSGSCDDGELSTSDQDGNSRGRSAGVDQESPVHHRSSNSDEVGGGGKACLSPPRHVSSGEFESDLDYNEEEDDQKKEKTVERRGKQVCVCVCVRMCMCGECCACVVSAVHVW